MKRIDSLRAIVFDFDGVILESANIKTEAFLELYAAYPDKLRQIREYHIGQAGISRYVKFEHIQKNILGQPYTEEDKRRVSAEFERLTRERIFRCPQVPGAEALLMGLRGKVLRIVGSGTPQAELDLIIAMRKMGEWFEELWGTPRLKPDILRDVMARHALSPDQVLMVGDGMSDYDAARETGTRFLARETETAFDRLAVDKVRDMAEMAAWLEEQDDGR
ncbi:MAG: HAD family phosphatase [Anaerolineales bacterium]|nr:HAD family phosphatase [Anaerolineales bacterium]